MFGAGVLLFFNTQAQTSYTVDPSLYQYSMTFTTTLKINGAESTDTADAIYAFVNGECRGVAHPIDYQGDGKIYISFLMVYGNNIEGDTVTFSLFDASENKETKLFNHIPFVSNGIYGSPQNPLFNVLEKSISIFNFISPNGDGVNDKWEIIHPQLYTDFKVYVYNQIGQQVFYKKDNYQNDWKGTWEGKTLPDGMYYYLVISPDSHYAYKGTLSLIK